jgi:predicted nucleic acid-binding protein
MWKMPSPPVVSNNTPLVGLFNLRRLDILTGVYESVAIPRAVEAEFLAIDRADRTAALRASGVATVRVRDSRLPRGYVGLDHGEAEVLALGYELNSPLLVLDDRKARGFALRLGFKVTGTAGLLVAAKKRGLVDAVGPLFSELQRSGLYLAPEVVRQAIELAGE